MGARGSKRSIHVPLILCGDFKTVRYPSEKYNCNRINRAMKNLSEFIEDMEFMDIDLAGEISVGEKVTTTPQQQG